MRTRDYMSRDKNDYEKLFKAANDKTSKQTALELQVKPGSAEKYEYVRWTVNNEIDTRHKIYQKKAKKTLKVQFDDDVQDGAMK